MQMSLVGVRTNGGTFNRAVSFRPNKMLAKSNERKGERGRVLKGEGDGGGRMEEGRPMRKVYKGTRNDTRERFRVKVEPPPPREIIVAN